MRIVLAALCAGLALGGCSTKQVTPVAMPEEKRICIIENPKVIHDFKGAYQRALEERGFQVEVFPDATPLSVCRMTTRYTANWRWDLTLYLAYAELRVYNAGQPAGRAVFHGRSSRFFTTEGKIKELVDELFPK